MGIGHFPKQTKRPRTTSDETADDLQGVNEGSSVNDKDHPTTTVLYTVFMNNNAMLTEMTKMFQFQFNEDNLIMAELEEVKKANAHLVKRLDQLSESYKPSSNELIVS